MLLYDNPISGNCYKVRLLFAQLGIACEHREVDVFERGDRPELLGGLNPALALPTLILDDGRPLAESGAILAYFAEGTEYLPTDGFERAQVLQWLFFEQHEIEPNLGVIRFLALAEWTVPDAYRAPRIKGGRRALAALEGHLGDRDFIVGERYSIADIALFAYVHVAPEGGFELEPYPSVRAWLTRVAAQPGHIPIT